MDIYVDRLLLVVEGESMNPVIAYFEPFPDSAKNGIIALLAAWIFFLFSLYQFYLKGEMPSRILIIAAAACFVVVKGYNWGRILCTLSNAMIILWCLVFTAVFMERGAGAETAVSMLNVVLFSASTYYLWTRDSRAFFKTYRQQPAEDSTPGSNGGKP